MSKNTNNTQNKNPFAVMEEDVLNFWEKNKIFEKSVKKEASEGDYVFYDGPPFATGLPHYGHIVASIIKDVVPRYWTMRGYRVERKWGWDCHGLPIENIVEKELGSTSKKDIEKTGVAKFNEMCRSKVLAYADEWKKYVRKLGRWVEMEESYKTMDKNFMESVWWVFKKLYDKGLIYEGYRSMHVCPRCETTLSQSEVAEGYKDVKDLSCVAKFELVDLPSPQPSPAKAGEGVYPGEDKIYILAWTTTPWTLIGNVALAVNPVEDYLELKLIEKKFDNINIDVNEKIIFMSGTDIQKEILGEKLPESTNQIIDDNHNLYEIVSGKDGNIYGYRIVRGSELENKAYKPLFNYYSSQKDLKNKENGWKVYAGDFVTTEEGTGVVHIAPAFGEDDMKMGEKYNLPFVQHVGMDGNLKDEVKDFKGMNVKPKDDHMKTDIEIIKYLAHNNLLFSKEKYEHSYPHCWRCDTPLLNYATSSLFVKVIEQKEKLLETAKEINWTPKHIKEGRFGKWLQGARDWSISRQRFWASTVPIWKCECGEKIVIGSVAELEKEADLGSFYIMRHGEAESNVQKVNSSDITKDEDHLVKKGREETLETAKKLKEKKIDLIICSDFLRTRETADIVAKEINVEVIRDQRIREVNFGDLDNKSYDLELKKRRNQDENLKYPNGESWSDLKKRITDFYKEYSQKYKEKKILIISHGDTLIALQSLLLDGDFLGNIQKVSKNKYIKRSEARELKHRILDLHKHTVDEIKLKCKCGKEMQRVPDVLDCWFESGSMPYAQMHYPFENKEKFENNFPAQFIAEGADQTRCWFYYLHVLAGGLKNTRAFNNVIVNGIVLAEDGKKMSKKLKNYPDPMDVFAKYGADALRHYLLSSPVMLADTLCFSEKGVQESLRKVCMLLNNVMKFYLMFVDDKVEIAVKEPKSDNVLDQWILARLNIFIEEVTKEMNEYNLPKATRPIAEFIDDLSTWYIRRSRDRFKSGDKDDKMMAVDITGYVLLQLSKTIASFTPFIAEEVWQKVTGNDFKDENKSVHLEEWPRAEDVDVSVLGDMKTVREIVEMGLAKRDETGIKVRQPLSRLVINHESSTKVIDEQYLNLIKDEVNVKIVEVNQNKKDELTVELDTEITEELKLEGIKRELVRFVNSLRKDAGLTIQDDIGIYFKTKSAIIKKAFDEFRDEIMKDTLAREIKEGEEDGKEVTVDGEIVLLAIKKL